MRRTHKCLRPSPCSTGWFPGARCLLRKEPCNSWREVGSSIRIWFSPGDPHGFPSPGAPGPAVRQGGRECSQVIGVYSWSVLINAVSTTSLTCRCVSTVQPRTSTAIGTQRHVPAKYTSPRTMVDAMNCQNRQPGAKVVQTECGASALLPEKTAGPSRIGPQGLLCCPVPGHVDVKTVGRPR